MMRQLNTKRRLIPLLSLFTMCIFLGFNILLHHDIFSIESYSFLEDKDDFENNVVEEEAGGSDERRKQQYNDIHVVRNELVIINHDGNSNHQVVDNINRPIEKNEESNKNNSNHCDNDPIHDDDKIKSLPWIQNYKILTGAWIKRSWAGFCNQYFTFIGIIFLSNDLGQVYETAMEHDNNNNNNNNNHHDQHPLKYQSNQIYMPSIQWKDLYGTNQFLRHEVLFDVQHWNKYYPKLPKLVYHYDTENDGNDYNSDGTEGINQDINKSSSLSTYTKFTDVFLHYDERGVPESTIATQEKIQSYLGIAPRLIWNHTTTNNVINNNNNNDNQRIENATNPYPLGYNKKEKIAWNQYKQFSKRLAKLQQREKEKDNEGAGGGGGDNVNVEQRVKMQQYELILKDAFRPHPELQSIIDNFKISLGNSTIIDHDNHEYSNCSTSSTSSSTTIPYMVLHARIEPDMQKHPMCRDKKVTNLTHIINAIYDKYPSTTTSTPPTSKMIILLNKQLLEEEVSNIHTNNNTMAKYNLSVLNDILQNGLWDGQMEVIEAGSKLALESNHEIYSKHSVLVGGIINFFLSIEADIFIGTEVSSYSTAVINSRYYRHKKNGNGGSRGTGMGRRRMNYFYDQDGLHEKDALHWFDC